MSQPVALKPSRTADDRTPTPPANRLGGARPYWPDEWRTPLLDAAQEVALATRIEAGLLAADQLGARAASGTHDTVSGAEPVEASDDELRQLVREGQEAWQRFHTSNIGLVLSVVREVAHGVDDDLVQQGLLALGEAVRRYDSQLGYRFSTFALHWIRNAVVIEYRRRASVLSVTNSRLRNLALVGAVRAEIAEQGGVDDVAHVAARLGRPHDWVQRHWTRAVRTAVDIGDLDEVLAHWVPGCQPPGSDGAPGGADAGGELWWLERLPHRERELLALRFGLGGHRALSCAELARRWGCPVSEVRALHRRALEHARELAAAGPDAGGVGEGDGVVPMGGASPGVPLTMGWLGLAG